LVQGPGLMSREQVSCLESRGPVVGVLDEPYSAKPAQLSSHTDPPGYYRMDIGHGSSLCRLAGLYGYSAEPG
jgi:hypothetical protein